MTLATLMFAQAMPFFGQPSGWTVLAAAVPTALMVYQAVKTKQMENGAKDRTDAIAVLEKQLARLEAKVDALDKTLNAERTDHGETLRQLNERTLELADARTQIGRLSLQRDELHSENGRLRTFRDLATIVKATAAPTYAAAVRELQARRKAAAAAAAQQSQTEP